MKLAIMQPYLFPYLGYFQLLHAVDAFVIYDDVNYIKGGWSNRNYILSQGQKLLFTVPVKGASQNRRINELEMVGGGDKLLRTFRHCYSKAPEFNSVYPLLESIFSSPEINLSRFLDNGLRLVCAHLSLCPQWYISSALYKDPGLRGQEKILAICEELGATYYINAPGGRDLYDHEAFDRRGVKLSFLQSRAIEYRQFGGAFVSDLSIIDVLMFNDHEQCGKLITEYELV